MNTMDEAVRRTTINGSDARAIMSGGGEWVRLWREKTGRTPPEDLSRNFKVQLGSHTEPFHLDWIEHEIAEDGWEPTPGARQRHQVRGIVQEKQAVMLAFHADDMIHRHDGAVAIVEAKHSSGRRTLDELIDFYMPQMQHQMWVAETDLCLFSVIMGNEAPQRAWIGRSDEWLAGYLAACLDFWTYVESDKSPAVDMPAPIHAITPKARDAIPIDGMRRLSMDGWNEAQALAADYLDTEAAAKTFEASKKALKELVPADVRELYGPGLVLKRNKAGSILFSKPKE